MARKNKFTGDAETKSRSRATPHTWGWERSREEESRPFPGDAEQQPLVFPSSFYCIINLKLKFINYFLYWFIIYIFNNFEINLKINLIIFKINK